MKKIVIYHEWIPKVGGIESAVYNLAEGLTANGYDVVVAYQGCEDCRSLLHYAKVADVLSIQHQRRINADVCLLASNHKKPRNIVGTKTFQWIHSDYSKYNLRLKNMDLYKEGRLEYVAVSDYAKKVIEKLEGVKVRKVIHNIVAPDFGKRKDLLKLVTASRVSPEKGFGRMLKMAQMLEEADIRFQWIVYGDNSYRPNEYWAWVDAFREVEGVYFVGYKSDVTLALQECDYLVQLSDFEGCPYAILEALQVEKPCIVTNWNGVEELIQDGINGYIVNMDLKDTDLNKIRTQIPKFKHKPTASIEDWLEIL